MGLTLFFCFTGKRFVRVDPAGSSSQEDATTKVGDLPQVFTGHAGRPELLIKDP